MVPRENVPVGDVFFMLKENTMKKLTSNQIRHMFLEFFESKGHMIEPGAPLVPINDDTLLWINSGVAALKRYFDGTVKPKNPRIVNIQKSLRTNDIDNVGRTSRHHTFFEMMGNFSIGDYFKVEAIAFAYEFLFSEEWLGLDINKAYFSVHTNDDVAYDTWVNNHNIDPKRILRTDDNYWMIGNGPSGPNSEIFYDRGEKYDPNGIGERLFFEDLENDRYVEVWNIVFSQYDAVEGQAIETFKELPQKNIDTGMGFERLVSIIQETESNFETDLFMPLIQSVSKLTDVKYEDNTMAYRVIVDHIRSLVFTLADGAVFSNEGRGYVLRRLLRRAVRYGKVLGIQDAFLYNLVDDVVVLMEDPYPYLKERADMIRELVLHEEKRFAKTLSGGEKLLLDTIESTDSKVLAGEVAFKLYDTYGFPIELTQEIAEEHQVTVDLEAFQVALNEQKERARSSRHKVESMSSQQEDILNFKEKSEFLYDTLTSEGKVVGLFKDGHAVEVLEGKGEVVVDITPFYAESGGQVSDTGVLVFNGKEYPVTSVRKANAGQHLHTVTLDQELKISDRVVLNVDRERRVLIRKNHSAVHLLQAALQNVVGDHVQQAGSYVDDEYFRFDFSHFERVNAEQLKEIEQQLNKWVAASLPIYTNVMSLEDAKATGAMALFSENYGDTVRVVSMGDVSKELCGGTHAQSTGEIGLITLVSEESVGSGVRRIVGKTSIGAYEYLLTYKKEVSGLRESLKLTPQKTLESKIHEMQSHIDTLQKEYDSMIQDMLTVSVKEYQTQALAIKDDLKFIWIEKHKEQQEILKDLVERLRENVDLVIVTNIKEDSVSFVAGASDKAIKSGLKAGDFVKQVAQITGGNGGGRPNFAQAGGKDITKLPEAKQEIYDKLGLEL